MTSIHSRRLWHMAVPLVTLALVLAACAAEPSPTPRDGAAPTEGEASPTEAEPAGPVVFLSTQLAPVEESEKMRTEILAGFDGEVEFIGSEAGPFVDRVRSQHQAGSGEVSLLGGLHGDFAAFDPETFLDLSDLAAELADLGVNEQFLELGRLGSDRQIYIPWMQATYIMVAHQDAMEYLPDGADLNELTWEQITEWGANITEATGERKLGFPAGQDGLLHRFFQGYAYPSFTGALNTQFATDAAIGMWSWLQDTWQYVNPQSTTYGFMQDPLRSGEVWVAWDHVVGVPRATPPVPVPWSLLQRAAAQPARGLGVQVRRPLQRRRSEPIAAVVPQARIPRHPPPPCAPPRRPAPSAATSPRGRGRRAPAAPCSR